MATSFEDPDETSWDLPEPFAEDDVRLSESVLERFIDRYTSPGDTVFDPFAGYGTSLVVAERMGRRAVGAEILPERVSYARTLISTDSLMLAGDVASMDLSSISAALIVSSPPYMNRSDPENPLDAYRSRVGSYEQFVSELAGVYLRVSDCLTPNGHLVIQLQNLRNEEGTTALCFDLYAALREQLNFVGEEVLLWQSGSYGYDHGYCLVYRAAGS